MKTSQSKTTLVVLRVLLFAITFNTISCTKDIDKELLARNLWAGKPTVKVKNTTVKSITSFGAIGDGKADNYQAFVDAAAYASSHPNTTINFPAGTYYIAKYRKIQNDPIDHIWWRNCKGLKLIGAPGTKISFNGNFFRSLDYTVSDGSKKGYVSGLAFWFEHCTDLEIRNFEMTGNVQKTRRAPGVDVNNPSVTESQNIMLRFTMCDQVIIDNIYAHHAECDGLKIGGDRINGVWINSTNFTVTNVRSYNNGRLGMSIGGLDNGYFKNCDFKNNGFTDGDYGHNDPAGGVDIEPGEFHDNDNIKFESCNFENSYGSHFMCTSPDLTKNITLLKCTIKTVTETPKTQGITILAENTIIDQCTFKLKSRVMKFTNPLKPGSTIKFMNSLIETSGNCWTTNSLNMKDKVIMSGNQINFTENSMTKNVIQLQMANMQFLDNKIFIPAAALKSRPNGTHAVIQNAIISKGNRFYSNDPAVKPTVNYTGTKTVADLN